MMLERCHTGEASHLAFKLSKMILLECLTVLLESIDLCDTVIVMSLSSSFGDQAFSKMGTPAL